MMIRAVKLLLFHVALAITAVPRVSEARVVRFVVEQRTPFAGGVEWGNSGPYERLVGTAYLEVDPADPLNSVIVDLENAPRNARGRVEFSTPFFILRPIDAARGNHKIYYTANNRGNDALLNARTRADVGDNDLPLRMGFTIVDAGWEGDLAPSPTRLAASLPIATQPDGSPIVGRMRVEYSDRNITRDGMFSLNLEGSAAFRSYETSDTDTAHSTFTVRDRVEGAKTAIQADRWAFGRCPDGRASLTATTSDICYFDGFRADKLYELIYPAKNPIVMGLGHAATRDVASFLRYDTRDAAGNPNPLAVSATASGVLRMYATGASQTGGFLRDFIYLGFNEDESHRKVFDGIIPTIAGTDRVFINVRFADPNVYSSQDVTHDFLQSSYPPFTYAITTDPVTGIRDGIMKRPQTDPLLFQIDSATEFWQLRAWLNVTDTEGRPVPLPPNVRLYFNSSTGHGFTTSGLRTPAPGRLARCENPTPTIVMESTRALLVAMDAWADRGIEPPASNYPRLEDSTLVSLDAARAAFPMIPGATFPPAANRFDLVDFGPTFGRLGGVLALQPPRVAYQAAALVPKTDQDGLDIAGIRPMQIRVPLGTSTGWNVRAAGHRAPDLCGLTGSFIPFARTKGERLAAGDSRLSLEERYPDRDRWVDAVSKAAADLVQARFLLQEDADRFVAAAKAREPFPRSSATASPGR
jgi:alpha/beta hydrolase family protein